MGTDVRSMASTAELDYPHGLEPLGGGSTLKQTLERLGSISVAEMSSASNFVRPLSVTYQLDGAPRRWDMVRAHPSVGVALYHTELKALVLVRQFRPAVYVSLQEEAKAAGTPPPPLAAAFTYELCAGILDKSKSPAEVAQEEISEECGYAVELGAVRRVGSYHAAIGISGARHTLFTAEVDETMRRGPGGGLTDDGEAIEVLALPLSSADSFVADQTLAKSAGLLLSLYLLRSTYS